MRSIIVGVLLLLCSNIDVIIVSAQDDDDIILMRIVPDLETQELPCANNMIVYECQQLIPSIELIWILPNEEILILSEINETQTSIDGNYIATITNRADTSQNNRYLFTSTLMIQEPVDNSMLTCTGGDTLTPVRDDVTIIFSGPPYSPRDLSYNDEVIIESSVDLQWNRPSYNGGSPIVNYIVCIDDIMTNITTSNETIIFTLPENINDDIHLSVKAINLCGLESGASDTIIIPAEAPPNIMSLNVEEFDCSNPFDTVFININWEAGDQSVGIIFPPVTDMSVELSGSNNSLCSDTSFITNCCAGEIERDIYTITITQTNNIGSTMYTDTLDAQVTMEDYIETNEELNVIVTINELCLNDTNYPVQVVFGTRPIGNDVCTVQKESEAKTLSSGDSEIFSVSIDSTDLEDDYEYCYIIIVNNVHVTQGDPESDDDNSPSLSIGGAVAITLVLTLLVSLPVGVIIGICIMWCVGKSRGVQEKEQQHQLEGGTNVVVYEEPDVKIDTDIPLSDNKAYSHVNMQRRRN